MLAPIVGQTTIISPFEQILLMQTLKGRLPQLDLLVAFEAAARQSSFMLAGNELNITASAVSQQIRNLEMQLGVTLFLRGHRSVQLTDQGRDFQISVTFVLNHLAGAVEELRASEGSEQLVLATDTSIASLWLMPRLAEFEALHPDISLKLKVSDVQSELLNLNADVAIIHGEGNWEGYVSELLLAEEAYPVCAPELLEGFTKPLTPEILSEFKLIDLDYEQWHWMSWSIWLTEAGYTIPSNIAKLKMNNYPLVIDAARRGLGFALGWDHLVDDDLEKGILVRPFEDSVTTKYGYHVVWPYRGNETEAMVAFRSWLLTGGSNSPH